MSFYKMINLRNRVFKMNNSTKIQIRFDFYNLIENINPNNVIGAQFPRIRINSTNEHI